MEYAKKKTTITFRTDAEMLEALDQVAKSLDRDRSFIIKEAVAQYLTFNDIQVAKIKRGIAEADAGLFVPEEEMEAFFRKYEEDASD